MIGQSVRLERETARQPAKQLPAPRQHAFMLVLTMAWTMGGVIFYLVGPRAAPILLPMCMVAPAAWLLADTGWLPWKPPSAVFIALILAAAYLLINGTWSLSPSVAYGEIGCLVGFTLALYITLDSLAASESSVLRAMAVGVLAGTALAGAFICLETFDKQAVHRLLMSFNPSWAPSSPHMHAEAGVGVVLEPHLLNRSMTALTLLFWPAVLILQRLDMARRTKGLLLIAFALAVAAIFKSEHTTSKIALVGAAATFALCLVVPRLAPGLVITGWIASVLLVAPMASLAYHQQLYLASWLPKSAQMRLVIWGYTSGQIPKAPLLGVGVSTARALREGDAQAPLAPGSEFQLTAGWHSHNVYLQAWYETGAIGALLLLGLGLLVLRSVKSAPADAQPYLYAAFVACALIAGFSFSLWAPWFMASFGLAAVFAMLGRELAARPVAAGDPTAT